MTVEANIKTTLDGYSALSALVSSRNYAINLPQNPTYPNSVYSRTTTDPLTSLSGANVKRKATFQIDVRGSTYASAVAVTAEVINAMKAATLFTAIWTDSNDVPYEDDTTTYRIAIDFSIWYTEE